MAIFSSTDGLTESWRDRVPGATASSPSFVADGNDDVPFLVPLLDIPMSRYDLLQREASVDDRLDLSRFDRVPE